MSKPLYSPGPIEPAVDLYDPVVIVGATGPIGGDKGFVRQVMGVEPIPSVGQHGVLILYSSASTAPAGYELYGGEAFGALNNGGQVQAAPTALQLAEGQLLHFRMNWRVIGTLPTGLAVGDFDFQVSQPASSKRWSLPGVVGSWNQAIQVPLPADPALSPSQGSDTAVATTYPDTDAFSPLTEIIATYQNSPTFVIVNHGDTAIASTDSVAIGIAIQGFRYTLMSMKEVPGWIPRNLGGTTYNLPPGTKFLPVAGFASGGIQ
jgi:hypothetical protein